MTLNEQLAEHWRKRLDDYASCRAINRTPPPVASALYRMRNAIAERLYHLTRPSCYRVKLLGGPSDGQIVTIGEIRSGIIYTLVRDPDWDVCRFEPVTRVASNGYTEAVYRIVPGERLASDGVGEVAAEYSHSVK